MSPGSVAPLFVVLALLHGVGVISRFDDLAPLLPVGAAGAILIAQVALLFVGGFFEASVRYGETNRSLPLWMRIRSRPIKFAFALGLTYICIVVLQTWDIQIGPVNPSPPDHWTIQQKAPLFAIMTLAALFPSYLLAASLLIPMLRTVARPLRAIPLPAGLAVMAALGLAAGWGARRLVRSQSLSDAVDAGHTLIDQHPLLLVAIIIVPIIVPILLGSLLEKRRKSTETRPTASAD